MGERLAPVDWQTLARVFEADGFRHARTKGGHRAYVKAGIARPIIIPCHGPVGVDIILSNMRTAGMSRERFFELLRRIR